MRRASLGLAAVLTLASFSAMQAQVEHPWLIRARGIVVAPNASSDKLNLDVNANATVEVDINRYLTDYLSLELILATTGHEVKSGSTSLGMVNVLPPTLLLQVRPLQQGVSPYLGAGGNIGYFYSKSAGLDDMDLSTSLGWAVQGGVDVPLGRRGVFNIDGKYIHLTTDVKSGGTTVAHLKINPLVIGAGLGYRF